MASSYNRVRLFKSDLLEKFSVVHPSVPAIIFLPILGYFFVNIQPSIKSFLLTISGMVSWTFVEYCLHRFIFHLPITAEWAAKFSYTVHGIHHKDPIDPLRLVAPPIMSLTIGSIFLYIFYSLLPKHAFFSFIFGFTLGYLCYDYLHWLTHHNKSKNKFIYYLRKNHAIHHHKSGVNFGVTSPLWDYIFRSVSPLSRKNV